MVQAVTTYTTEDGKQFNSIEEANAHEAYLASKAQIEEVVGKVFPPVVADKNGKDRANPHFTTAVKAVAVWIASQAA